MELQPGGDVVRVKALMEADPKLNAAAVNIVCTVAATATPREVATRLSSLFGREVEVVAYEDDERDRITVTGPQDVYEAMGVWKRGKANPLKMWVRALGPLTDPLAQSSELHGDDSYWNDKDVGGGSDILSFVPPQALHAHGLAASATRPRRDSITTEGIRFKRTEKILGRGAFGIVYQGVRDDGSIIAVKEMSFPRDERDPSSLKKVLEVDKEICLLQKLEHVHCVRYLGSVRTEDAICICLEYADGGSLLNHIQTFGSNGLQESMVKNYTRQILLGLNYLHKQSVVHRDVKSANILLHDSGRVLKLSDFGCSRIFGGLKMSSDTGGGGQGMYGTPHWMAPEVIQSIPAGRASDVWSLGCVVVEMVTGKRPWAALGNLDVLPLLYKIAQARSGPPVPADVMSPTGDDFLQLCFNVDPQQRPTTDALLEHGFIVGLDASQQQQDKKKMLNKANQLVRGLVKSVVVSTEVFDVLMCGHAGAGKTSLAVQFVHQHRVEYYDPPDDQRYQKQLTVDSASIVLNILDPGRSGVSSALHQKTMETAHGAIIVFSVTDRVSFDRVAYFAQQVRNASRRQTPVIVLVGNKCDLADRVVTADEGRALAQQLQLSAYHESGKGDAGAQPIFMELVQRMRAAGAATAAAAAPRARSTSRALSSTANNSNNGTDNDNNHNDDVDAKMAAKKCNVM